MRKTKIKNSSDDTKIYKYNIFRATERKKWKQKSHSRLKKKMWMMIFCCNLYESVERKLIFVGKLSLQQNQNWLTERVNEKNMEISKKKPEKQNKKQMKFNWKKYDINQTLHFMSAFNLDVWTKAKHIRWEFCVNLFTQNLNLCIKMMK